MKTLINTYIRRNVVNKRRKIIGSRTKGAVTTETAVGLLLMLGCAVIFWEVASLFLLHQKVTYAAYVGERARVVGGDAQKAVKMISGELKVEVGATSTLVYKDVELPFHLEKLWSSASGQELRVSQEVSMPAEPFDVGDNAWMPADIDGGLMPPPEQTQINPLDGCQGSDCEIQIDECAPTELLASRNSLTREIISLAQSEGEQSPVIDLEDALICMSPGNPGLCAVNSVASKSNVSVSKSVGNPVDVTSGNKFQREVDIRYSEDVYSRQISGILSQEQGQSYITKLPLIWERYYNSQGELGGLLGIGWRHGYQTELAIYDNRSPHDQKDVMYLKQADGRWIGFKKEDRVIYGGGELSERSHIYQGILGDDGMIRTTDRGYRWIWLDGRELLFDTQGRLKRILTPAGDSQSLIYNKTGQLHYITDSDGRYFELLYDEKSRIVEVKAPDQSIYYHYSEAHQLLHVEYADNSKRQYHYEDAQDSYNLTGITDERGVRIGSYGYNEKDQAIYTHKALVDGVAIEKREIQYQPGQSIVTDSLGRQSIYHYEEQHRHKYVTQIQGTGCTSCAQADSKYSYTEDLQLKTRQSKNGIIEEYEYDQAKRRLSITQVNEEGQRKEIIRYEYLTEEQAKELGQRRRYHGAHRYLPLKIKRASVNKDGSHEIELSYNQRGQIIQLKEQGYRPQLDDAGNISHYQPIIKQTAYQYSNQGNLLEVDGPKEGNEDISRFEYQRQDFCEVVCKELLKRVINAKGEIVYEVKEYDQAGRVLESQSMGLLSTKYEYDKRGRMIGNRQGELITNSRYDKAGYLLERTEPDSTKTSYKYDEAGRQVSVTGSNRESQQSHYDSESNVLSVQLLSESGEVLRQSSTVYDDENRIIEQKDANGVVVQKNNYDDKDRLISTIDGNGNTSRYVYDSWNQQVKTIRADNSEIVRLYDTQGRLVSIIDPRQNETKYWQDDNGLRVARLSADTGLSKYEYDINNNILKKTNASGVSVEYEYDILNRKIKKIQPEGETEYHYNRQNQLVEVKGIHSTEQYSYDGYGRKVSVKVKIEDKEFNTSYRFNDKTGKLIQKTLPDGQELQMTYYTNGKDKGDLKLMALENKKGRTKLLESIKTKNSNQENIILGNDIAISEHYNERGQLESLTHKDILSLAYQYDVIGNITGIERNQRQESYDYDSLYQLTNANMATGEYAYQYDEIGNRINQTTNGQSEDYRYSDYGQGNYLLKADNKSYQYNRQGSPVEIEDEKLAYDSEERLIDYQSNHIKANYQYNHQGERVIKQSNDERYYYLYEAGRISATYDTKSQTLEQYIYHNGNPMVQLENETILYLHNDHLGTPQIATDKDKQIIWKNNPHPFGNKDEETERVKLRFPGQYYDEERGTYYNYHRDYDSSTGRYQTSDPIGLGGGMNTFTYVGSNSIKSIDIRGLATYFCRRPLGGKPGESHTYPATHDYACIGSDVNSLECNSTTNSSGGALNNTFLFGEG